MDYQVLERVEGCSVRGREGFTFSDGGKVSGSGVWQSRGSVTVERLSHGKLRIIFPKKAPIIIALNSPKHKCEVVRNADKFDLANHWRNEAL